MNVVASAPAQDVAGPPCHADQFGEAPVRNFATQLVKMFESPASAHDRYPEGCLGQRVHPEFRVVEVARKIQWRRRGSLFTEPERFFRSVSIAHGCEGMFTLVGLTVADAGWSSGCAYRRERLFMKCSLPFAVSPILPSRSTKFPSLRW